MIWNLEFFSGRAKLVKRLVELGAQINKQDTRGYTALMWAVTKRKIETVYTLMQAGCDVNKRDKYGSTALDLATIEGAKQIEQLLRDNTPMSNSKLILTQAEIDSERRTTANASGDTRVHYGDMETVLSGLGLYDLIKDFQEHQIDLQQFLRMSDADLQPVVSQAGVRKKLVDCIDRLNKKEWEKTSIVSLNRKKVSCSEAIHMVMNIKQQIGYIASTMAYIQPHMTAQVLSSAQENAGPDQLINHVTETSNIVRHLYNELASLSAHLCVAASKPDAQPPDLVTAPQQQVLQVRSRVDSGGDVLRCLVTHTATATLAGLVVYAYLRHR